MPNPSDADASREQRRLVRRAAQARERGVSIEEIQRFYGDDARYGTHIPTDEELRERERRREGKRRQRERSRGTQAQPQARQGPRRKHKQHPARWHYKKTPRIGGISIDKGLFYAGTDISALVDPSFAEPSLLDPTLEVDIADWKDADRLPAYPTYATIGPKQRGRYIMYLASDRVSEEDIGYAFMYLYGFERRLSVDARRPGMVSDTERDAILHEAMRLDSVYGKRSNSFHFYVMALMLWIGGRHMNAQHLREVANDVRSHILDGTLRCDNAESIETMLLGRLADKRMKIPAELVCDLAARRARNVAIPDDDRPDVVRLASLRLRRCGEWPKGGSFARVSKQSRCHEPRWYQSSPTLRMHVRAFVSSASFTMPEETDVPMGVAANIVKRASYDVAGFRGRTAKSNPMDVPPDVLAVLAPPKTLVEWLGGRSGVCIVPKEIIDRSVTESLGTVPVRDGAVDKRTQQAYEAVLAVAGWQYACPVAFDGSVSAKAWRQSADTPICAFERRVAKTRTGVQTMLTLFDKDDARSPIRPDDAWRQAMDAGYVLAWFMQRCGIKATKEIMRCRPVPPRGAESGRRRALRKHMLLAAFMTDMFAVTAPATLKRCLDDPRTADSAIAAVLSVAKQTWGTMPSVDAMGALEQIYKKAGRDKASILYDYHAAQAAAPAVDDDEGFSIDNERLQMTLDETDRAQSALSEAFDDADEEIVGTEGADADVADDVEEAPASASSDVDLARDAVIAAFGGSDEASTADVIAALTALDGISTRADALAKITEINEANGGDDDLVEIDGADAYLNL